MADLKRTVEGNLSDTQDWRVWAEINYLDSATEYREYLPGACIPNPNVHQGFELLNKSEHASIIYLWILPFIVVGVVVVLILGYFLNIV